MSLFDFFEKHLFSGKGCDFSFISEEIAKNQNEFDNGGREFNVLPELVGHLGDYVFRSLSRDPWSVMMVDYSADRRQFRFGTVLALSIMFSKYLQETLQDKRIGIALPPGIGSHITNFAISFLDRTSVNLNFTLGKASIESAIQQGHITTIITTQSIKDKFPKFPWTKHTIDIVDIINSFSKLKLLFWMCAAYIIPANFLSKRLNIPVKGGDKEATILFSSGTTGTPKGIVLSHKNIIANCLQLADIGIVRKDDIALACLPIFHIFGMTVMMWFTAFFKMKIATYPSPLEVKKLGEIIEKECVTLAISTPTFFKQFFKHVNRGRMKSLRLSAAGAERVTFGLISNWRKTYGSEMIAAYGLTEASPVVSANLPLSDGAHVNQKIGSVGRILPGISVKFIGPETGRDLPLGETGILCLKGANIFRGYLNDSSATEKSFKNGWFITGDLARLDADGFLHIDGRISRFSKIGGEMVPHVGVEEAITDILGLKNENGADIAVMSRIDAIKGETIVLMTKVDIDPVFLREKFAENGHSNLWLPRDIINVDDIPCLATGKLDLASCKSLLEEKLSGQ